MIRRSFLQMALAALVAPLSMLRAKPAVETFGGSISSADPKDEYTAPVILRLRDGSIVNGVARGNKLSYSQPVEKINFIGDKRTYWRARGIAIQFDSIRIDMADVSAEQLLAIDRAEVPYIEFPTSCVAIDHEHASGRISMAPGKGMSSVSTKMDLKMTVHRPVLSFSAANKEAHILILKDALFSSVKESAVMPISL